MGAADEGQAMTVAAAFTGLMPIMWSLGTGADMMKRGAAAPASDPSPVALT